MSDYTQDGPEAQRIASVIPYYPFHGKKYSNVGNIDN